MSDFLLRALESAADAGEVEALPCEDLDVMLALLGPGAGFHLGRGVAVEDALADTARPPLAAAGPLVKL